MKEQISKLLARCGYAIRRITTDTEGPTNPNLELREYNRDDGQFDYDQYRRIQIKGNKDFIDSSWVLEDNISFLSEYLRQQLGTLRFGICHGTRRGDEQRWFRQHLNCEVIGTDISDTATQFPHTIQWDFHDRHPEWEGKADFIYSNALDHSYNPEMCLNTWVETLHVGGLCIIEHSNMHSPEGVTDLDPFGADLELMPYLIARWGRDRYFLKELIDAPTRKDGLRYLSFLVIERRR